MQVQVRVVTRLPNFVDRLAGSMLCARLASMHACTSRADIVAVVYADAGTVTTYNASVA